MLDNVLSRTLCANTVLFIGGGLALHAIYSFATGDNSIREGGKVARIAEGVFNLIAELSAGGLFMCAQSLILDLNSATQAVFFTASLTLTQTILICFVTSVVSKVLAQYLAPYSRLNQVSDKERKILELLFQRKINTLSQRTQENAEKLNEILEVVSKVREASAEEEEEAVG